jgi:hypothetical protein
MRIQQHVWTKPEPVQTTSVGGTSPTKPTEAATTTTTTKAELQLHHGPLTSI